MCPLYLGQLKEQLPVCREGRCQDSRCELERAPTKEALLPFAGIVSAASSNRSTIQLRWNDVCGLNATPHAPIITAGDMPNPCSGDLSTAQPNSGVPWRIKTGAD